MKRILHLTFGMAALMTLGTACTAEDPSNGLDIDQTIYEGNGNSDNPTVNPLDLKVMSGYGYNNGFCDISFDVSGNPFEAEVSRYYQSISRFQFKYLADNVVSSVKWIQYYESNRRSENIENIEIHNSMDNLSFEDGLLRSLIYSGEEKITYSSYYDNNTGEYVDSRVETKALPGHNVEFDYDGRKLVKITVDGAEYVQKWSNGDLVEINSPFYGVSTLEYSSVENRYGQWDPTMPLMGFFQTLGWFGDAPAHFPNSINTSAFKDDDGLSGTARSYGLDYYINYEGLIEMVRVSETLDNSVDYNLKYVEKK